MLNLNAAAGAFADVAADLSFGMDMERTYHRKLLWTRKGNENSFEFKTAAGKEPYEDTAQFDLTLNGSLFFGPIVQIDFVTVGDLIGARAKLKIGPEISGQISLGMLQNMRDYQQEAFGIAELGICSKVSVEGYTLNRHYLVWGNVDEHKIFNVDFPFARHTMKLFPNYQQTMATASTDKARNETSVSMAAALPEPTPTDIETGFEIVNPQGEVVDSVFVGTIKAEPEDDTMPQTFDAEMALPATIRQDMLEDYVMRPIFHYAGYTVSAAPVGIRKDVLLQPYTSMLSNGAMMFISSGPFLGSVTQDSTLYQVGAYLPVPLKQNIYRQDREASVIVGIYIDGTEGELLPGIWKGEDENGPYTVTFNAHGTGDWQQQAFIFDLNQPQSGELLLSYEDNSQQVFRVVELTEHKLSLVDKRSQSQIELTR